MDQRLMRAFHQVQVGLQGLAQGLIITIVSDQLSGIERCALRQHALAAAHIHNRCAGFLGDNDPLQHTESTKRQQCHDAKGKDVTTGNRRAMGWWVGADGALRLCLNGLRVLGKETRNFGAARATASASLGMGYTACQDRRSRRRWLW